MLNGIEIINQLRKEIDMCAKMSQLHLTLDEQAVELGFEGLGEALMKGYDVDYEKGKLVKRGLGYSETVEHLAKEQEKAHEAWLEEKNKVLGDLDLIVLHLDRKDIDKFTIQVRRIIENTIDFIEKGEV